MLTYADVCPIAQVACGAEHTVLLHGNRCASIQILYYQAEVFYYQAAIFYYARVLGFEPF